MFEDSLLESGNRFRTKRGVTTALSAVLQMIALGTLVLLPLLYTEALPRIQMLGTLPAPPPAAAPNAGPTLRRTVPVVSELHDGKLVVPRTMPEHAVPIEDPRPPDTAEVGVPGAVPHSTGSADRNSTIVSVLVSHTPPPPEPRTEHVILSGGVTEGHLVRRVEPLYPAPALRARIEGDVVLQAVIGRDGTIENLMVVSGHPFLAPAALEAVRQWRYQPFLLSGRSIAVDTQVVVHFRLSRNR